MLDYEKFNKETLPTEAKVIGKVVEQVGVELC